MTLPTTAETGYTNLRKDNTSADRRMHFRYDNPLGSPVSVSVAWPSQTDRYMQSAVVHVEDSDGIITAKYSDTDPIAPAKCVLGIPANGSLFVTGQRGSVYAQSAITLTDIDLDDTGTNGDNLHPAGPALSGAGGGKIAVGDPIPFGDYSPAGYDPDDDPRDYESDLIGGVGDFLNEQQDATTGGIKAANQGGSWDESRGWGNSKKFANACAAVHTMNVPQNPFYGNIEDRSMAVLFWELGLVLENGQTAGFPSNGYTGGVGLATTNAMPGLAIKTFWGDMTVAEKAGVLNIIQIIGHANAVMPIESTANQSFHFIHTFCEFLDAWHFVRNGEADENFYDGLLTEMLRVMFNSDLFLFGEVGNGVNHGEAYGVDLTYPGIQASNLRGAYHALRGITSLATQRALILARFDDMYRFYEPATGVAADGSVLISSGYGSRTVGTVFQYGKEESMLGVSPYPSRTANVPDMPVEPVQEEKPIFSVWYPQRVWLYETMPIVAMGAAVIESTLQTTATGGTDDFRWHRTPAYFAGVMGRMTDHTSNIQNSGSDGPRVGEVGEYGGPFGLTIEDDGVSYETEYSNTISGCLSGQGALESLSFRGVKVLHSRNLSPLTVHGIYAQTGTRGIDLRYYTPDPHTTVSAWDSVAQTWTTTFELYLTTGEFTRVIDMSDPSKITVSITAPADPGGGVTLVEVVPFLVMDGTPKIVLPDGFADIDGLEFGTENDEPNIGRITHTVSWGETLSYNLEEDKMTLPNTTYDSVEMGLPDANVSDFPLLIDLSRMSAEWWAAATSSDGSKGHASKGDGTELAVDWINYNNVAETGHARVKWSGSLASSGSQTVRLYPPATANASTLASDTYGSDNVYNSATLNYLPAGSGVDHTSNGADSTPTNGLLSGGDTGKIGVGTRHDGVNDYDILGTDISGNNFYSMMVWAKFDSIVRDHELYLRGTGHGAGNGIMVWADTSSGGLRLGVLGTGETSGSFGADYTANSSIPLDTWTHLACTVDISTTTTRIELYINGVAKSSTDGNLVGGFRDRGDPESIGVNGSQRIDGIVDEFILADAVRSPEWIKHEYTQGSAQATVFPIWVNTPALATGGNRGNHASVGFALGYD